MPTRRASCSCGQLGLVARGEPVRVSVCHCRACQRRTGSAFGVQARFHAKDVDLQGASSRYDRIADSGNRITFHFCPDCGSTVYYRLDAEPDLIAVPAGAFADPAFPPPGISVYETSRHPWVGLPGDMEHCA